MRIRYAILDAPKKTRIRVSRAFILRLRCSLISERKCTCMVPEVVGCELLPNQHLVSLNTYTITDENLLHFVMINN